MVSKKIKGLHIEGRKDLSCYKPIKEFLNPKFVYIPLVSGNVRYEQSVQVGEKVLKGQVVVNRTDRFAHPVCSPVSGCVLAIKKMWHPIGRMIEMLEIENDFEEKAIYSLEKEHQNSFTKEEIIEKIKDAGIVGLGGAGFPTYAKYTANTKLDVLIINAAECEPYLSDDYSIIMNYTDEFLRGVSYLMKASGVSCAKIAIKKAYKDAIKVLENALVNYEGIKLQILKNVYPAGWEKYIVQQVTKKNYNNLPSEVGAVVNNVQTAHAVSLALEQNRPLIERIITISGDGIKDPCNVKVKIGSLISDVIESIGGYSDDLGEAYFIAGGPMTAKSIMFDNVVVTPSLSGVTVLRKPKNTDLLPCMGCGKCSTYCPAFLTPTEIKLAYLQNDIELLKDLNVMKCVQCGMCSYVCPSRIEVTETVGKAKEAVIKAASLKK